MKTKFKNLLIAGLIIPALSIGFTACEDDDEGPAKEAPPAVTQSYQATIHMAPVSKAVDLMLNTANKPYTNAFGQNYSVSRLQYLISDISFNKADGSSFTIEGYHYYDMEDSTTESYIPAIKIPEGEYSSISFTFGLDEVDNITNAYSDLNLINWNWPDMVGGGYHFMRLEGDYESDSVGTSKVFRTHMGTARNDTVNPMIFEANHFEVTLPNSDISITEDFGFDLIMDINEWYEDTYLWDFNVYNAPIMPIYDAQKRLNENGPTVFTMLKK